MKIKITKIDEVSDGTAVALVEAFCEYMDSRGFEFTPAEGLPVTERNARRKSLEESYEEIAENFVQSWNSDPRSPG